MLEWTGIYLAGLGLIAGVLAMRRQAERRWRGQLVTYALRFSRGASPADVAAFVAGLSGLSAASWRRPVAVRAVVFETTASTSGIAHHLAMARADAPVVLASLRAALPNVSVVLDERHVPGRMTAATELRLSDQRRVLNVDQPERVTAAVLASVQPLSPSERMVIQWTAGPVSPMRSVPAASERQAGSSFVEQIWDGLWGYSRSPELTKELQRKQARPLFVATGRIGAVAASPGRARALVGRVVSAYHAANAPNAGLRRRAVPSRHVARWLTDRRRPLVMYPCVLNAEELAAVSCWPMGEVTLPGLNLGGCRLVPPTSDVPSVGRVVARSNFPGSERPLAISVPDSLRHLHVIGPTGSGKSTLLTGLITADMKAGNGVVVIEPKGDLVADVLERVPEERLDDVIVLDPMDERPVGLNLLACAEVDRELVVDQIASIFATIFRAGWGARTDDLLRAALATLAGVPGMTLTEIPLLLTNSGFRRGLVGRLDDPVLEQFWSWYEGLSDSERTNIIAPLSNKLRAVLMRRRLRNVVGQSEPILDLDRALAERKILLVPLAKGLLGESAAALMGSLVVARVWQAVMRRTAIPASERPVTFGFIDEFQDYLNTATSVEDMLAQARGLGLSLTLAHQHLGQLPDSLQKAVLANARSRVIFQVSRDDARKLSQETAPHLEASDLQGLGAYEVVAKLSAGARIAPPATGVTVLPPEPTGFGKKARRLSRERYGEDRDVVEAAIRARHDGPGPTGSLGRREVKR
ncbi:type IV secretory system conjugative DNA transfer family protein [Luedemannella flava]|uniref:Type IV secretory system conjugative DNA transfer family protein n=1 Tax=Luedemannella flava TaxID=349316 RepID=A0ABN2LP07_9ACTN